MLNGVRHFTNGRRFKVASGGERITMLTLRDSLHLVTDPENLDETAHEVFETLLGEPCRNEAGLVGASLTQDSVTAVVGFGGILSGACVFRCNAKAAREIAGRMTGMEFGDVDELVKDAIGEICNILAGTWKGKVPGLAANCGLSVPAVITGRDYQLHVQSPEFKVARAYTTASNQFEVMIVCDGLQ
jgi:chemotaxis protein CheX